MSSLVDAKRFSAEALDADATAFDSIRAQEEEYGLATGDALYGVASLLRLARSIQSPHGAGALPHAVQEIAAIQTQNGFNHVMAMEATTPTISMEAIAQTVRALWKALVDMIKRSRTWVRQGLRSVLSNVENDRKNVALATQLVLRQRMANKSVIQGMNQGEAFYMQPNYVSLSVAARYLLVKGAQPTDYVAEFARLQALCDRHKSFLAAFDQVFVEKLTTLVEGLQRGERVGVPLPLVKADDHLDPFAQEVRRIGSRMVKPGCMLTVVEDLMGGWQIVNEFVGHPAATVEGELAHLASWRTDILAPQSGASTGTMRNLTEAEIAAGSAAVDQLAASLLRYHKSLEALDDFEEQLGQLATKLSMRPEGFGEGNDQLARDILQAIQAIIGNLNRGVVEYSNRAAMSVRAWGAYMVALHAQDKKAFAAAGK